MARQTPGNYVPLDVNYARDIAVRKAGTNAELLYIRSLAYAKGARTSGFVSDFDLEVVAVGMRAVKAAAQKLIEVGLWVRVEDGWLIRSWDRWNASERIVSAGGKLGNHKRWHVDRGETDPACDLCSGPGEIAPRSHPDSPPISPPESQGKGREGKGTDTSDESDEPDLFADFYDAYPRKEAKRKAEQAWRAAIKRGADPADILIGLQRFEFSTERRFIPLPASWLNADRWSDQAPALAAVPDGRLSNSELENLLGPDVWSPPDAPAGMDPDEAWEWQRERRLEHIAERQSAARARMGRTA